MGKVLGMLALGAENKILTGAGVAVVSAYLAGSIVGANIYQSFAKMDNFWECYRTGIVAGLLSVSIVFGFTDQIKSKLLAIVDAALGVYMLGVGNSTIPQCSGK